MPLPRMRDQELELMILGDIYRDLSCSDRMPKDILNCESLNWEMGAPDDASDLLAHASRLSGEALVRESFLSPDTFAMTHIRSTCDACEYCLTSQEGRCVTGGLLSRKMRILWSRDEWRSFIELRDRLQNIFRRWEHQGLIDRCPPTLFKGSADLERASPEDDTWAAKITTRGLDLAKKLVPGTEYAHGPRSLLWALDPDARKRAPQWMQKEYIEEGGKL